MPEEANLLVTFDPSHDAKAKDETAAVLKAVGEEPKFLKSGVEGVFLLRVKDPKKAVTDLVKVCKETPDQFGYTFHWVPIEKWLPSDPEGMSKEIAKYNDQIPADASWKIDLGKRHWTKMSTSEAILKLTEGIDKPKVDLKNPDIRIKVEILGDKAGISLLKRDELLDVPEIRKAHDTPHQ